MISTAAFPISQALGPRLLLSVCFLTWSPHWFLGNFLSRLLILCLLEEIWIMAKLDHFLLCLMIFQSGVLSSVSPWRLQIASQTKQAAHPLAPVPGRAAHCSAYRPHKCLPLLFSITLQLLIWWLLFLPINNNAFAVVLLIFDLWENNLDLSLMRQKQNGFLATRRVFHSWQVGVQSMIMWTMVEYLHNKIKQELKCQCLNQHKVLLRALEVMTIKNVYLNISSHRLWWQRNYDPAEDQ